MGCVESYSILRNTLRDLRRIEFYEKVRETSLEADSRAIWQILCDFVFLRLERLEFYDVSTQILRRISLEYSIIGRCIEYTPHWPSCRDRSSDIVSLLALRGAKPDLILSHLHLKRRRVIRLR
jgi:hypothetical protein